MPTYQYKCETCGVVFERKQHFTDEPLKTCPECNGPVHRVIQPVGILFKGPGFYVTDNRKASSSTLPPARGNGETEKTGEKESKEEGSTTKSGSGDKATSEGD